jgi:2',3'-cyclic-nucleotide 2'-phosphodiesterase (5'-nucleotidase family)
VLAEKRAKGPVVVVDAGGSLAPVPRGVTTAPELEQRRAKAQLIAQSYALAGIDAMALGSADWSLGLEFVKGLVDTHHLPVLAANLTCGGVAPYPGTKIIESGGYKVGVVGVTLGTVEGCEIGDPADAVRAARPALEGADLVLALIPVDNDRTGATVWSAQLPVDLAIDARGRAVQSGADRREDTYWLSAGSRGKTIGFLDLAFRPGGNRWVVTGAAEAAQKKLDAAEARVKSLDKRIATAEAAPPPEPGKAPTRGNDVQLLTRQREAYQKQLDALRAEATVADTTTDAHTFTVSEVQLGAEIADHAETAKLVAATKAGITESSPSPVGGFVARIVTDPASPYAGGEACVACHKDQHAQWSTTGHARAWQALVAEDRANDDDCWTCHVTGAGDAGGPVTPSSSGPFRDVQCESCHGAGRAHIADPPGTKLVAQVPVETCKTCHDGERDGGRFDPATYLPKVSHGTQQK